ncbi:hypothetical protein [Rufibacter tibetensis]|uniref:SPOR domain-containing protein n=1 Tax=Rufibacter tibetensis TaxID=512763 RepID=A0A0P0C7M1_9BACT|nr:hypothetical protein [Rufibacter tibetensis]ALI99411.1 hypothetical protein DC20_11095 [Rufibacter tibetensis]
MKKFVYVPLWLCLFSCEPNAVQKVSITAQENAAKALVVEASTPMTITSANNVDSSQVEPKSKLVEVGDEYEEYATYYVTIADTGRAYYPLREKMLALSKALPLPIDTMGRYYDAKKALIVLPEDNEDEMFAGDYFPRRNPDAHLSLEYLDLYQKKAGEKTIALVSGIYEKKASADSALRILKNSASNAFMVKTEMYIGCIH